MKSNLMSLHRADLVISLSYRDGIRVIKDRQGDSDVDIDLVEVLERMLPYQEENLQPIVQSLIDRLKNLRVFM